MINGCDDDEDRFDKSILSRFLLSRSLKLGHVVVVVVVVVVVNTVQPTLDY